MPRLKHSCGFKGRRQPNFAPTLISHTEHLPPPRISPVKERTESKKLKVFKTWAAFIANLSGTGGLTPKVGPAEFGEMFPVSRSRISSASSMRDLRNNFF